MKGACGASETQNAVTSLKKTEYRTRH